MEMLQVQRELRMSSASERHSLMYPLTCVGLACAYEKVQGQHPNWETAQMQGWSSLRQKWLTVLIKSGPINTIFEGGDIDPPKGPHVNTPIWAALLMIHQQTELKATASTQAMDTDASMKHRQCLMLSAHISAKWTATCEWQIWTLIETLTIVEVYNSADNYMA